MRKEYPEEDLFSPPAIKDIDFGPLGKKSRLVPLLYALQSLYYERADIVRLVFKDLAGNSDKSKGREGMNAWRALVLLTIRTGMNYDYVTVTDMARHHIVVRDLLGVSQSETFYPSESAVHENIMLLSQKTIKAANDALVEIGVKKNFEDGRVVRGDSFVCRTNTHYPTDVCLIRDGVESIISLCVKHSDGTSEWRQHKHLKKKTARLYRSYMQLKRSRRKRQDKASDLEAALRTYLKHSRAIIEKALDYMALCPLAESIKTAFPVQDRPHGNLTEQIGYFIAGTEYICCLAERRGLEGEQIPHEEKVHSLYEPHTELIKRGKYPNPVEFGHRVFLAQGKSGLILSHQVMGMGVTDEKILLPVLRELHKRFNGKLQIASFDKGFYTPDNIIKGRKYCELIVIPKRGRLSKADKAHQGTPTYRQYRQWRSGVESLISSMVRSNGLDQCPDKGYARFVKYVSACVLSRNLQTLGSLLMEEEEQKSRKNVGYKRRA